MTNSEVLEAYKHFDALADLLGISGEAFRITFYEAVRMRNALEDIAVARKILIRN